MARLQPGTVVLRSEINFTLSCSSLSKYWFLRVQAIFRLACLAPNDSLKKKELVSFDHFSIFNKIKTLCLQFYFFFSGYNTENSNIAAVSPLAPSSLQLNIEGDVSPAKKTNCCVRSKIYNLRE